MANRYLSFDGNLQRSITTQSILYFKITFRLYTNPVCLLIRSLRKEQKLHIQNCNIQETTNMSKMLAFCMLVILVEPAFATMDIVRSTVSKTGYVGENIYMRCFDSTDQVFQPRRAVLWMYLFHDDCTVNSTFDTVARCEQGFWEYQSYGHHLVGKDYTCLAYMRATEPGNFTYKCQEMYRVRHRYVIQRSNFHNFHYKSRQLIDITVPSKTRASITKSDL